MGLLDTMKQADEQQSTTETLAELTSRLPAVEPQLTNLTGIVADLTEFVKVMDEQQDRRLTRLSTSQQPEQPSTLPLDDETRNRLSEIEKTLAAVASQLSASGAVKLPDGSSVRRSDLEAHAMMTRINETLATTSRTSAELADVVKGRSTVRIDTDKVNAHFAGQLDQRLQRALAPSFGRVEAVLVEFEQKVATLGAGRAAAASAEVEAVLTKADEVITAVRAAEGRVEQLSGRVTWAAVGRLGLALLPLATVLLVVGGLVGGVAYAAGFGPLLGWAWDAFAAAQAWWQKTLVALGTLAGVAGFGRLVWWLAKRLGEDFRHW
ncbi:hypothetical protein AK37_03443 [Rhodococcus pyridinivorans AK37]|uniref:Uncharacterized protein n=1 Tax=Rhodococcus pyridinivorans AK37 TaxID=1114960 RepID=H0JM70_9NOCA|nr:hypothetical protein AK37_03443 [Rhodococcus pyridinivorans AK37]